jgi:6-pyruvoyltetrahydropterin/6-carboxytetrahydropterin synthase
VLRERGERVYVMDTNPTAENIARMIYERAATVGLPVVEVTLWETESCHATYRKPAAR